MNSLRYIPGEWYALVNDEHAVLLPADTSTEQVTDFWDKLQDAVTVESLLSELLSIYQMNIASLPNFALVSREAAPHTVLRGSLELRSRSLKGEELVSGAGIATWAERQLADSQGWTLGAAAETSTQAAALPIQEGIVRVSALSWDSGQGPSPAAAERAKQAANASASTSAAASSALKTPAQSEQKSVAEAPKPEVPEAPAPASAPVADSKPAPTAAPAASEEKRVAEVPKPEVPEAPAPASAPVADSKPAPAAAADPDPATEEIAAQEPKPEAPDAPSAPVAAQKPAPVQAPAKGASPSQAPKPAAPAAQGPLAAEHTEAKAKKVAAQDADNEDTFIPSSDRGHSSSGVNEQTQDPEDYEQHLHSAEFSLASQLLGIRGATGTEYETGDGDDLDTIIKSRAAATSASAADEHTIIRGIKAMKPQAPPRPEPEAGDDSHSGPTEYILARSCEQRHPNPPTASTCHTCGATLSGPARQVRKPAMGRMTVRDRGGIREYSHELNRSVVLGRQPSASAVNEPNPPRLLQIDSPSGDISRSHLLVRLEGWHVQLVDLGATNGTMLLREGQAPRRLSKNQEVMLKSGDVADLGDGVSLRFEDLP
ncbi:FHA domain-containing protein [Glutamicibacter sp. TV12E]|uniref:FHA domain-containing protein n=1 Tax=Glutamicibacter sp. TV12E TaxID=3446362 RepID=UPI0040341569